MAEIISTLDPGWYSTGQSLTVTFPADTRRAIITRDDRAPVLSEVLAYDEGPILPIPSLPWGAENPNPSVQRPFIAVTQDGRGNVVYDGGFPKFWNTHIPKNVGTTQAPIWQWPELPYTWEKLPYWFKYLDNCIKFCANPRKLASGNRKILLIGNTAVGESYCANVSWRYPTAGAPTNRLTTGFKDSIDAIAQAGNWDITNRPFLTQSSKIDLDFDYLDQFTAVIFLNSFVHNTVPGPNDMRITEHTAQELSLYRMEGNGVIIITDHCGDNYDSLDDALARNTIYGPEANRVSKYYGAYFSGDVARIPVLVSDIKMQLGENGEPGDHVLLEGLPDDSYIYAGGSESLTKPQIFDADIVPHDQPWSVTFDTPGVYRVNVLVQLDDGTILTKPMRFVIIDPSDINLTDSFDRDLTSGSITYKNIVDYTVTSTNIDRTMSGRIRVGGSLVGYFNTTKDGDTWQTKYFPFSGSNTPIPIKDGQELVFEITDPFEFHVAQTINIADPNPYYITSGSVSTFTNKVKTHPYFSGIDINNALSDMMSVSDKSYIASSQLGVPLSGMWWGILGKSRLNFQASKFVDARLRVYTNLTDWENNKPVVGNIGDAVIVASNNQVYYWDNLPMVWQLHPSNASTLFELGRGVVSTLDDSKWLIQSNNTVKVS